MTLIDRFKSPGPKRMLALDGGGIRGAITLGYLVYIEKLLRQRYNNPNLLLCEYFDLIGGTSTGAIIATGLASGMSATELANIYQKIGGKIFSEKTSIFNRLSAKFKSDALQEELANILGDATLGSDTVKTGLCIITKRADTGSTWPLFNHPEAKFFKYNKNLLLRQAVRASTAAPTYFQPESIDIGGGQIGAFVDGGVSMYNDPSMMLFLMSTLQGFPFNWKRGAENLMLVSIGTGTWDTTFTPEQVANNKLWDWAGETISMLMNDAKDMNQMMLQYLSQSPTAKTVDSEIGDLSQDLLTPKPALHYLRYDAELSKENLDSLGFKDIDPMGLHEMSKSENREILAAIGAKAATVEVKEDHFPKAFDL